MRYRKLDVYGDMPFGHGSSDYYVDEWKLVLQAIVTRLKLWQGEWYLDESYGTPWTQEILGKTNKSIRNAALKKVILETYGVEDLAKFVSKFDRTTRSYKVNFKANTIYGTVEGSGTSGSNSVY